MNDQHDLSPVPELEQEPRPEQPREPSMNEVGARISDQLLATEEAQRTRIRRIVWELGRTQALALCAEVLAQHDPGDQAPVDRYFALVAEKGVKKERPWLRAQPERRETPRPSSVGVVARHIAEQLGESEPTPQHTIFRSVRTIGVEAALEYLRRTQEIEAAGGMMLPEGSKYGVRRRTPGGVYFYLLRQELPQDQQQAIFWPSPQTEKKRKPRKRKKKPQRPRETSVDEGPRITWEDRGQLLDEKEQGVARTVKMTLLGRPGEITQQGKCVAFSMQQGPKIPPLPAGLPLPKPEVAVATRYSVFVATKQWAKVAEAIASDPDDFLIIEGYPTLDLERGTIAVFASNVTTRKIQAASRTPKA